MSGITKKRTLWASIVAVLGALVLVAAGSAHHIAGHPFHGHVFCVATYGFVNELKVEPAANGTYDDTADDGPQYGGPGPLVVTISNLQVDPVENVMVFDWSSNVAVGAVLVQAGNEGLKYDYDGATGDSNVASPADTIDHISFCYYHHHPSAVVLQSFAARKAAGRVIVSWRAASEVGVVGYDVYREAAGRRARVNTALIPAGSGGPGAHAYRWVDRSPKRGGRYWLRETTTSGAQAWHGPAKAG